MELCSCSSQRRHSSGIFGFIIPPLWMSQLFSSNSYDDFLLHSLRNSSLLLGNYHISERMDGFKKDYKCFAVSPLPPACQSLPMKQLKKMSTQILCPVAGQLNKIRSDQMLIISNILEYDYLGLVSDFYISLFMSVLFINIYLQNIFVSWGRLKKWLCNQKKCAECSSIYKQGKVA